MDIRFLDKTTSPWEGNVGIGYRQFNPIKQQLYGFYIYYDRKRSNQRHYFSQMTLGSEFWLHQWFLGANIYIPVGRSTFIDSSFDVVQLHPSGSFRNIFYGVGIDTASPGADIEAGYALTKRLTTYLGTYYYKSSIAPTTWGPLARIRYAMRPAFGKKILGIFDQFTVESQLQYDNPRGINWYMGARLTIQLGKTRTNLIGVRRHMIDPPLRDINVVVLGTHKPFKRLNKSNGEPVIVADVHNKSELDAALVNPNVGVIAVHHTISGLSNETLLNNQTITGRQYLFSAEGENFTAFVSNSGGLEAATGENLLRLTSNNTVSDLTLTVDSDSGNQAISNDNSVINMGSNLIDNVRTNGRIVITRDGAGRIGNVSITNSVINTGTWNPGAQAGAVQFDLDNNGTLNVAAFQKNTISTSGVNADGLDNNSNRDSVLTFQGGVHQNVITSGGIGVSNSIGNNNNSNNSSIVFNGGFYGNTITAISGAGVSNLVGNGNNSDNDNLTFNDGFHDNTINAGAAGIINSIADSNNASNNSIIFNSEVYNNRITSVGNSVSNIINTGNASDNNNIIFNGRFYGNTITSTTGNGASNDITNGNGSDDNNIVFGRGISNNIVTATVGNGFSFNVSDAGGIMVSGFSGNQITAGTNGISLAADNTVGSNISISVNSGTQGLSTANGGTTVNQSGTMDNIHIVPLP